MKTMRSQVAYNIAIMDILLAKLVNNKLLTEREITAIYTESRDRSWDDLYQFFREDDVDEF